jgi:two-component system, OmpR family, sensor histidine kinase TctE
VPAPPPVLSSPPAPLPPTVAAAAVRRPLRPLTDPSGPFARPSSDSRSLFGELLDWVLAPLLFLWPMSLALTWGVAQGIAHKPYDAELARQVQALAAVTESRRPTPQLREEIRRHASSLLEGDEGLPRWYQVLGSRGELLAGEAALTVPADGPNTPRIVQWRDDVIGEVPVRVAWMWLAPEARDMDDDGLVQVAEALDERERLATEIIKGVLLPQFAILPLAVMLVWLALTRGIRPLEKLQRRIRKRESSDLSPIDERGVPEEVAPLVRSINDLLQRLDKSIAAQRHFLADAAHQLKTPLAGLRTQAELAAREIDSGRGDPASMKHSLRQIAVSSQRAAHMVNQLLAMARAEDSGEKLRRQWVDLAAITRAVVRDFVPRAIERRIDLGYEGPEGVPAAEGSDAPSTRLLAEPVLVGELVRNLVDNGLQYTPAGGSVTARVLADPGGRAVILQVEDTGPGIVPAERERVFLAFYRPADNTIAGSGLGLAIVKEVADRHGATITLVDARPRRVEPAAAGTDGDETPGALFTVRFPRDLPGETEAPHTPHPPHPPSTW